ncbi:DUF4367 domain-containing protein [Tepidibacillus decaturensis]|uniref:DUF4367 domain-containing protein n=1 Tax=Tepidibacillus decaturensis TaxID=1413211 RepID=A0A135L400_9BACI|nr:DUF4367 domain-containing protein [Tepidibacillus decaturensis]KXG43748.1 hypothetical protein U473_06775 [Tepidibacillus decaturensis]
MRKSTDRDIDQWIKEAVREEIQNSPPPPLTTQEAWEQLSQRLHEPQQNKYTKRSWPFFRSKLFYVACIMVVMIFVLWKPNNSSAFAKLTEMFHKVQGTIVQLFVNVGNLPDKDENAPTSEDFVIIEGSEITSEKMSLEEAQKQTAFTIKIPQKIPEEFTLNSVTVIKQKNQPNKEVYLHYQGSQRMFMIYEKTIDDSFGASVMADEEDTKIEEVNIHGQQARLLTYKNETLELVWVTSNYYFSISGKLSREEIINIAKSIQ